MRFNSKETQRSHHDRRGQTTFICEYRAAHVGNERAFYQNRICEKQEGRRGPDRLDRAGRKVANWEGLMRSAMMLAEEGIRKIQIEKGELIPREDFEDRIWNQQIDFFEEKIEEYRNQVDSLQEQFDSDDLHLDRAQILLEIQFAKSQIVFFEKQIIKCNYDLYLLNKNNDKEARLLLTPYY